MNDMVVASLLGSKIIKQVPRFAQVENWVGKHVMPVLPYPQFLRPTNVFETNGGVEGENWQANLPLPIEQQFFPLTLSVDGSEQFTLPYEPLINIQGKNNIVKRSVLKYNEEFSGNTYGTVKERWSTDDYKITITGVLFGSQEMGSFEDTYPREDFEKLKLFLLKGKEIQVYCEPLALLGIHYIAIEEFNFPFTKGENVQAFEIKALSDVKFDLIVKE